MRRRLSLALLLLLLAGGAAPLRADEAPEISQSLRAIFTGEAPQSLADLRAMQDHVQQLAQRLIPATVGVQVGGAQGSGVVIDKEGHVLTAAHVCGKPDQNVTFMFPDGKRAKGRTLGCNRGIDAGLMIITDEGEWPYAEMGDYDSIANGHWVLAIGHPGGYQKDRGAVVRLGRVLSKRGASVSTDCTLVGGDSGGPLFNMAGEVIGIHSRIGGSLTANIHVPIGTYHETWDRLLAAEDWGGSFRGSGPYIGVVGDPEAENARIAEVQEDSPAAKAGILPQDVVIEFAGQPVTDFSTLSAAVRKQRPDKKVKVRVQRGEEVVELELTIGKREG